MVKKVKRQTLSELLSTTWKEYKANCKQISKFQLYVIVPIIAIAISQIYFLTNNQTVLNLILNPTFQVIPPTNYILTTGILSILYMLSYLFVLAGLIATSVHKKKLTVVNLRKYAGKTWTNYIWYVVVILFFLIILYLLLIVPGIIFTVYWLVAAYIFLEEKTTVRKALAKSKQLIKGKWWQSFGYLIVLTLIAMAATSIVTGIMQYIALAYTTQVAQGVIAILNQAFQDIVGVFITAYTILFFKNYYFELKK